MIVLVARSLRYPRSERIGGAGKGIFPERFGVLSPDAEWAILVQDWVVRMEGY